MYKVLICDDEPNICYLINDFIDWESLDLVSCGFANSGSEALSMIELEKPDIVITDIRMPIIDGLEMIRQAKESGIDSRFIVISGYQQFDYAKTALKYGVIDYLLKPIDKLELNNSIIKTIEAITADAENSRIRDELSQTQRMSGSSLLKAVISCLSTDNYEIISSEFSDIVKGREYAFLSILFDHPSTDSIALDAIIDKASDIIRSTALDFGCEAVCTAHRRSIFIMLLSEHLDYDLYDHVCDSVFFDVMHCASIYPEIRTTLAAGHIMNDVSMLKDAVSSLSDSINSRIVLGTDRVIKPHKPEHSSEFEFNAQQNAQFVKLVDTCDSDGLAHFVAKLFHELPSLEDKPYIIVEYSKYIISVFLDHIRNSVSEESVLDDIYRNYTDNVALVYTVQSLSALLANCFTMYFDDVNNSKFTREQPYVQLVKNYIHENYASDCTLSEIADRIHLNVSYLSTLFKTKTGIGFAQYLLNHRMSAAKKLLKETNKTVEAISEEVGYSDLKNFRKQFKDTVGITPNKFRSLYQ